MGGEGCDPMDYHICKSEEPFVTLIHTGPELLQMFKPSLRVAAEKRLRDQGVTIQLNSTVTEVTGQGIKLASGSIIPSATIIWAAGVKPIIPHFEGDMPPLTMGRAAMLELAVHTVVRTAEPPRRTLAEISADDPTPDMLAPSNVNNVLPVNGIFVFAMEETIALP